MASLENLTQAVKDNTASVDALAARIAALPPGVDQATVDALTAELVAAKAKLDGLAPAPAA